MTKAYSKISGYDRPHIYVFILDKKNFHSGECFQKFPDTAGKYAGYVWTQAIFVEKKIPFSRISGYVWTTPEMYLADTLSRAFFQSFS